MDQKKNLAANGKVILPLPPEAVAENSSEMDLYARFMRHLRHVPNNRTEIKILSAIQFTADMMDYNDAQVAKVLIDLGLRAPRMAFPADFLDYVDKALMRSGWEVGGPTAAMLDLKNHWDHIGEDKFAVVNFGYSILDEQVVL